MTAIIPGGARLGAAQNVALSGVSAASTAFGAQTRTILVVATAACQIRIGDGTPTAATTDTAMAPNFPMIFVVTPGQKIAGVGTGTLSVTELT
jgi:hypothetical protein